MIQTQPVSIDFQSLKTKWWQRNWKKHPWSWETKSRFDLLYLESNSENPSSSMTRWPFIPDSFHRSFCLGAESSAESSEPPWAHNQPRTKKKPHGYWLQPYKVPEPQAGNVFHFIIRIRLLWRLLLIINHRYILILDINFAFQFIGSHLECPGHPR